MTNKIIDGNQFTITWHVKDLKLSHRDETEVTKLNKWLKSIYGQDMRVSRGKKHDYLGMDLEYTIPGEVEVTMVKYLKGVIEDFPECITGRATTPAADRLFNVRAKQNRVLLDEK
jgi:hypothetical protein